MNLSEEFKAWFGTYKFKQTARTLLARKLLRNHQRLLSRTAIEANRLRKAIARHAGEGNVSGILAAAGQLNQIQEELQWLKQLTPLTSQAPREFVFSSLLLKESFSICTESAEEGMHFFAGIEVDGALVATKLVQFPYATRSIASASGDHLSTHRICIEMHEAGHRLLALIHAHPGSGAHANIPSSVDLRTHARWESQRALVGGIWSRDGYLRFFSSGLDFNVKVIGNHVEQIEKRLFRNVPEEAPLEV